MRGSTCPLILTRVRSQAAILCELRAEEAQGPCLSACSELFCSSGAFLRGEIEAQRGQVASLESHG